jgi:hypothetical protein
VTRALTITAAEWASAKDGTLWLVGQGGEHWAMRPDAPVLLGHLPPAEFVQACAPCETCEGHRSLWHIGTVKNGRPSEWRPCPDCCIELVGSCPTCDGDTNDEFHPCAKSQRDGQHCNCSMEQDHCHWCGLEWLGDGEIDCPPCKNTKTVTLGYAYAVGQPLPIVAFGDWLRDETVTANGVVVADGNAYVRGSGFPVPNITDRLAHYGPPESLVGMWALQLQLTGEPQ